MLAWRRLGRSRRQHWRPLCQHSSTQRTVAAAASPKQQALPGTSPPTVDFRSHQGAAAQDDEGVGPTAPWTIIQRPVLETLLKSYAQHATVAQPLILHGPRGVGKRTVVERLVWKWSKWPHVSAYVDLYPDQGGMPPWTLPGICGEYNEGLRAALSNGGRESQGTLGIIQTQLEQSLEALTMTAVEKGRVNSENVLDALLERHSIDGALCQYLRATEDGSTKLGAISSEPTKEKWKRSIQLMKVDKVSSWAESNTGQLSNASFSRLNGPSGGGNRKPQSTSKAQSREETLISLELAKKLLKIQEDWRVSAGSNLKGQGIITRTLADAATSWAVLLLRLLSFAAQEGKFQPKLVINNLDLMRKAAAEDHRGSVHGSLYHDSLLMHMTKMGVSGGCIPIIFVSSDSYYSRKLFADHGDKLAFISEEVLGWTPNEAAIHLVPAVFEESEWKVITGVLGPTARHLAEIHSIWNYSSFLNVLQETNENAMGDCIDLYLGYLQVTAVDPAMESAIAILEKFASDCSAGKISKRLLRHGVAWRHPPSNPEKRRRWAKVQILDYIQAMAVTDFAVNHRDVRAQELLEDPSTNALMEVGLIYQQKNIPYIRPVSRGVSRCLVRWYVREKLNWSLIDKLNYTWHRLIRGRFFKQLIVV